MRRDRPRGHRGGAASSPALGSSAAGIEADGATSGEIFPEVSPP
ncbi:hypothetical protein [Polyangium spumosum]|nr:hypothetical protein [Polyangium spumosum]